MNFPRDPDLLCRSRGPLVNRLAVIPDGSATGRRLEDIGRRPEADAFYGVVVDSVKVSALLYVPVRRASLALTSCENSSVTASFDTGALQVSRFSGEAEEPTLLNAGVGGDGFPAFVARACSGCGREYVPLTRWPVALLDGSATLNSASPAEETTFAVVDAL